VAHSAEVDSWEFGRTVRRWRDRVTAAGISVDYLTRLEQGRATSSSAHVVEALARALRVSDAERDLLFRLAGHATPGLDIVSSRTTPSMQRLLDRLVHTPVAAYDATWTLLVANAPYDALMGSTTSWQGSNATASGATLSVRGAERSTPPTRSANSKRAWLPTCV
jgi:transcriptional regulator with XRE-family HTH domain